MQFKVFYVKLINNVNSFVCQFLVILYFWWPCLSGDQDRVDEQRNEGD